MASLPSWCPIYSSLKHDPVTGQEVYCICKKPDEGGLMVGCDGCDDWFHFKCLKIPECYRSLVFSFFCPYCQAGVTGLHKDDRDVPLPKSLWKRKCRLSDCYLPCAENSKYCSEEHGLKYMKDIVQGIPKGKSDKEIKNEELLTDMLIASGNSLEDFKGIGQKSFIYDDIPNDIDPDLYNEIIETDSGLQQLMKNVEDSDNVTFPELKKKMNVLEKYIGWINEINTKLNSDGEDKINEDIANDEDTNTTQKKITKKRIRKGTNKNANKKKTICGYISDYNEIPCTSKQFVEEYKTIEGSNEQTELHDVCIKLRCVRHMDWLSIRSEQFQQQLGSLDSYKERLGILIRTRKRQLHIRYYEKQLEKTQKTENLELKDQVSSNDGIKTEESKPVDLQV